MQPAVPAGWVIAPVVVLRLRRATASLSARGDVDALPVRAHRHRAAGRRARGRRRRAPPRLADAAGGPGGLGDRPGGRVAVEAHHGVAAVPRRRRRSSRPGSPPPSRGRRARGRRRRAPPRLADAAGGPGGLGEVAGHRERARGRREAAPSRPARARPLAGALVASRTCASRSSRRFALPCSPFGRPEWPCTARLRVQRRLTLAANPTLHPIHRLSNDLGVPAS